MQRDEEREGLSRPVSLGAPPRHFRVAFNAPDQFTAAAEEIVSMSNDCNIGRCDRLDYQEFGQAFLFRLGPR
jgi:hypothetical protein